MFWILAPSKDLKDKLLDFCFCKKIQLASHYQSLAKSPAGMAHGSAPIGVETSEMVTDCLVRLPLWHGMTEDESNDVLDVLRQFDNMYN